MQRLDHFMTDALIRYYDSRDPLGKDGDFTTAPEISQLFGEIIGVWAAQQWVRMGSPSSFNLIELGPGRGTLMMDLLRGTQHVTPFHDALNIHLIETSSTLKQKQQKTLEAYNIQWHDHLSAISKDIPCIIIANEFFDALPVRQFQYDNGEWLEHYIDGNESVWHKAGTPPSKATLPAPTQGDIVEYSDIQEEYAHLISEFSGIGLIIDYGYSRSAYGDTLQALHKHQNCEITDHIGGADLTTHIDFEWLSHFFKQSKVQTQGEFLQENGIAIRYHQLNNPSLRSGYERLIHPDQMGTLFKAMTVLL